MQFVVFKLGREEYAFDIETVQEIVSLQEVTKLPNMPEFIEGVMNLRGKVIPILNLVKKFNLHTIENEFNTTKLIVINLDDDKKIAVKADEVSEVLTIDKSFIDQPPNITKNDKNYCLNGIAKINDKLIILLDSNKIIDSKVLQQI